MAPPALPAVGQATFLIPKCFAMERAIVMPRDLKLPVGKRLSSLTNRLWTPNAEASRAVYRMGVMLSVNETIVSGFLTGNISRYRQRVGGRPKSSFLGNCFLSASRS